LLTPAVHAKNGKQGNKDRRQSTVYYPYLQGNTSNLPPGLAKRGGDLPPGLQKHLRETGQLPPGLEKKRIDRYRTDRYSTDRYPFDPVRRVPTRQSILDRILQGRW
jgi:hypothetical protein